MSELPRPLPPPSWRDRLAVVEAWRPPVPAPLIAGGVAVILVAIAVVMWLRPSGAKPDVALTLPRADAPSETATTESASASPTTTSGRLQVHAAGAVVQPGVVAVHAGARVIDVVAAAGGAAPNADLNQINLAELVSDGERIYVPHVGETVAPLASASSPKSGDKASAIVNLNEASESELEALPGVGPATAKAIVDYRTQNGRFRSVDDLLNVRGIGPAKLEQIKPYARV